VDDFVEYSARASRVRMTSEELEELHRLGEQKASRERLEAFFRRIVDRAEGGRREGAKD
jgi:hypothetical protein